MIKDAPLPTRQQTNRPTREDISRTLAAYGGTCESDGYLWAQHTDGQGNSLPGWDDELMDSGRKRTDAFRAVMVMVDQVLAAGGAR